MEFYTSETNIVCCDIDRSLNFYHHVLGFELIERENGACRLRFGTSTLLLLPFAKTASPQRPYCSVPTVSLDLLVDDVEAAANYLQSHNVVFEEDVDPNLRRCIIRDPDGLFLEIIEKDAG